MEARIHDGDDKVCPFDKDRNSIAVDVQNWTKHFDRRLLRCQSFDIYGNTGKYGSAATFENAAKTKLESSLDVQTRIQFGRPNKIPVWIWLFATCLF